MNRMTGNVLYGVAMRIFTDLDMSDKLGPHTLEYVHFHIINNHTFSRVRRQYLVLPTHHDTFHRRSVADQLQIHR